MIGSRHHARAPAVATAASVTADTTGPPDGDRRLSTPRCAYDRRARWRGPDGEVTKSVRTQTAITAAGKGTAAEPPGERLSFGLLDDADPIDDAELTALALAADPDAPLDPDAVPLHEYLAQLPALLPAWYMPGVMARPGSRWRAGVVLAIVAAFLFIEALGLCSTFGQLSLG